MFQGARLGPDGRQTRAINLILAVVAVAVEAALAAVFQRHAVPCAIPCSLNVDVSGREPRFF